MTAVSSKLVRNVAGEPRCPKCDYWNPVEAEFCIECGARLDLDWKPYEPSPASVNTSPAQILPADLESVSDAELFNDVWRLQVAKNTKKFYESLNLLPLNRLKSFSGPNSIGQRLCTIDGSQESGKTAKAEAIAAHLRNLYEAKNVCVHELSAENFHSILDAKDWPRRPIQAIIVEDITNVKFKEDPDIRDFWRIRHIMQAKTGLSQGLVLLCMTAHSWFRFQKEFRVDTDAILISDLPKDEYDKREYCRRFIPNEGDQERLKRIGLRKIIEPAWKGFAYAVGIGFIYLPRVPPITPDRTYEGAPVIIPKPTTEPKSTPEPIQEEEEQYTGSLAMRFKRMAVAAALVMLVTAAGWIYIDNSKSLTPYLFLFLAVIVLIGSRKTLWPPKKM